MTKMDFRPATDATELFELAQDANGEAPWPIESFERDLNSRFTSYLVLALDAKPIGFVAGTLVIDELSVSNVAIGQAYQGRGYGQMLLKRWLDDFAPDTRVLLEVRASNIAARHVYENLGFHVYHMRKDYYHHPVEDAYLMDCYL